MPRPSGEARCLGPWERCSPTVITKIRDAAACPPPKPERKELLELPPPEVVTRQAEVSCTCRVPYFLEQCSCLPLGGCIVVPCVLQAEGLAASLRVYPNGDDEWAGLGKVSVWMVLSSRRAAMVSASVALTNAAGLAVLTQSFSGAELGHEPTMFGWAAFCDIQDIEPAKDRAIYLQVSVKYCAKSCPECLPVPEVVVKAAPDHVAQLRSDLRSMRGGQDGDVVLIAEGKEHKAHRALLHARSPVLRALLDEAFMAEEASEEPEEAAERPLQRLVLERVDSQALSLLLDFLYTADIPPGVAEMEDGPEVLGRLMDAAERFQVPNLEELCVSWLKRDISHDNMLRVLEVAHQRGTASLKEACLAFATRDAETVQVFQDSHDFDALPSDLVRELFVYASGNCKRRQDCGGFEFASGTDWQLLSFVQLQRACDERALPTLGCREELLAHVLEWETLRTY